MTNVYGWALLSSGAKVPILLGRGSCVKYCIDVEVKFPGYILINSTIRFDQNIMVKFWTNFGLKFSYVTYDLRRVTMEIVQPAKVQQAVILIKQAGAELGQTQLQSGVLAVVEYRIEIVLDCLNAHVCGYNVFNFFLEGEEC